MNAIANNPSPTPDPRPAVAPPDGRFAGYRMPRFVVVSTLVHLAGAAALGIFSAPSWKPKVELTWLDLDNKLGAPQPPKPPKPKPKPEPEAEPPEPKTAKPKVKSKAPALPKKKKRKAKAPKARPAPKARASREPFTTRKVALTKMAPGDAALMLLLRMDRIRRSPHADAVRRLLEVFYDYKTLLWSPKLDPVRDFDALLIATPNPYRVTETFLAIRHRLPAQQLRGLLEESVRVGDKRMRWRRGRLGLRGTIPSPPRLAHDRRRLLVRRGLAMLSRPEHEALLLDRADRKAPAAQPGEGPKDEGEPTLLDALKLMDLEGGGDRKLKGRRRGRRPGLLLQAVNLRRLVRLPRDIPPPSNIQVTVPATEPALVEGVLTFADRTTAKRFLAAIGPRLQRARSSILLRLMGIGRLLDRLRLKAAGAQVEARVRLSGDEVRDLLDLFGSVIPQVRVPGMPPRNPRPRRAADAGAKPAANADAGAKPTTNADAGAKPAANADAGAKPTTKTDAGAKPATKPETGARPDADGATSPQPAPAPPRSGAPR